MFIQDIQAQMEVESFRLIERDMTAQTKEYKEVDRNGEVAALIKVVTTEQGFNFTGGMVGIVKTKQEVGEIWVYVPHGIKRLTIRHPQYGVVRDYPIPISIEKALTYELKLKINKPQTINDPGGNFFVLHPTPLDAVVYIDGKLQTHKTDGSVSGFLPYGEHNYRVEATGYNTQEGSFVMGNEKIDIPVQLLTNISTLTIKSPIKDGLIYLNGEFVDSTEWVGQLAPGMYLVELRASGYKTRSLSITLNEREERILEIEMPDYAYGTLSIDSDPLDCDIYLDDELIGKSPGIFQQIRQGSHRVEIRKEGYKSTVLDISIDEGATEMITPKLELIPSKEVITEKLSSKDMLADELSGYSSSTSSDFSKVKSKQNTQIISPKKRKNAFLYSLMVPGLGDKFVRDDANFNVGAAIGSYGLIGAGIGMHFLAENHYYNKYLPLAKELYDSYLTIPEEEQRALSDSYELANKYRKSVPYLIGAGAAVWLYDVIWVAVKGRKSQNTNFTVSFEPQANNSFLSYSITF